MKQKTQSITYWFGVVAVGLVVGLGAQFAQAWTPPPAVPAPGGNVQGPLNTSGVAQEKAGPLTLPWINLNTGSGTQTLYGSGSLLVFRSADPDHSQMLFEDSNGSTFGRIYGVHNGGYFGMLDGDNQWSMVLAKDSYTQFRINNQNIMFMLANGNVGIGNTTPSEKLDVSGNIEATGDICLTSGTCLSSVGSSSGDNLGNHTATQNLNMGNGRRISGNGGSEGLYFVNGFGTFDRRLIVNEDIIAHDGVYAANVFLGAELFADLNSRPGPWLGQVTNNHYVGSTNFKGSMGVRLGANNPNAIFAVAYGSNQWSEVWARGFRSMSDVRYKDNIATIQNASEKVSQMRGVSYIHKDSNEEELGVIAQEIEEIVPEVVSENAYGYKMVNYQGLIPVLVEAMKEQQVQIDELESMVTELSSKVNNQ